MKGIYSLRFFLLILALMAIYLFVCDFNIPIKNIGKRTESVAYVDSVKNLELFEIYSYNQIYYHYFFDSEKFSDSVTSNKLRGNVNRGDTLVIVLSKMNPGRHTIKSFYGRKQYDIQYMGR